MGNTKVPSASLYPVTYDQPGDCVPQVSTHKKSPIMRSAKRKAQKTKLVYPRRLGRVVFPSTVPWNRTMGCPRS